MFIDLSVLTAEVVRGQSTNKIKLILFSVQEDYAGYDFENRLHVRIHSAFASMAASAQPWTLIWNVFEKATIMSMDIFTLK